MVHLIDVLTRFSKATNISLPIMNDSIDLNSFFLEAYKKGYLSLEAFEEINDLF